jgi:cytoskeletal protein CcmA (bactofilin family)
MTNFVINLFNKLKKQNPQKDPVTNPKPNSKNDLISSDPILLNQPTKGNVYCSDQVIIDGAGKVIGHIHSKSCVINGYVKGNILCSDSIEVKNTAIIEGNVKAGSIEIEAGSIINGFISIDKKIKLPVISKRVEETAPLPLSDKPSEVKTLIPEPERANPPVLIQEEDHVVIQVQNQTKETAQPVPIPSPEPVKQPIVVVREKPVIPVSTEVEEEAPSVTVTQLPESEKTADKPKKKSTGLTETQSASKVIPPAREEENGSWW